MEQKMTFRIWRMGIGFLAILGCIGIIASVRIVSVPLYSSDKTERAVWLKPIQTPNGKTVWESTTKTITPKPNEDVVFFSIDKDALNIQNEDDLTLTVSLENGKQATFTADIAGGDERALNDSRYFFEPVFIPQGAKLHYTITSAQKAEQLAVHIATLSSTAAQPKLTFGLTSLFAATGGDTVGSSAPTVVSRSDWWADEELRYTDSAIWKPVYAKADKPKTQAQKDAEAHIVAIRQYLNTNFPAQMEIARVVSTENGRPLVWPEEKVRRVSRIVLHHTAENNLSNKDDLTLIRGIYYYHAVVRGWGDIGYNYLIGQRGTVYEGRAGGAYVSGAHAVWNNHGTVGVSVMGNFDEFVPVKEQTNAIGATVEWLSKRYGIDVNANSPGHRECKSGSGCLITDSDEPNLVGHRDVGYTACPGANLYSLLETYRTNAKVYSAGLTPVENVDVFEKSPVETMTGNLGPNVRIRLSYSGATARLESATAKPMLVQFAARRVSLPGGKSFEVGIFGTGFVTVNTGSGIRKYRGSVRFTGDVLRVASWNRVPAWDSSGLYNDNLFRDGITAINDGGKLVLVNTLPLERYLRGIAEVPNDELPEKAKALLTAARTYAYFYTDPNHRKFAGKPYDGSDNPDEFQKYLGYSFEKRSPKISEYVAQTRGQLITLSGSVIKPWYFSQSDGRTRSYQEYCQARVSAGTFAKNMVCEDIPYLQSVTDPSGVGKEVRGHGVGMSGGGARYLAEQLDFTYIQILQYFYDGVAVTPTY